MKIRKSSKSWLLLGGLCLNITSLLLFLAWCSRSHVTKVYVQFKLNLFCCLSGALSKRFAHTTQFGKWSFLSLTHLLACLPVLTGGLCLVCLRHTHQFNLVFFSIWSLFCCSFRDQSARRTRSDFLHCIERTEASVRERERGFESSDLDSTSKGEFERALLFVKRAKPKDEDEGGGEWRLRQSESFRPGAKIFFLPSFSFARWREQQRRCFRCRRLSLVLDFKSWILSSSSSFATEIVIFTKQSLTLSISRAINSKF